MPSACLFALMTMTAAFQRMNDADAALNELVAREPRLALGRDRVHVGRAHRRGEADLKLAGPLEELADEEPRPGLAVDVDDAVEAVEPLLGLFRVDVGKLVHEPVEDHGAHSLPAPIVSGALCEMNIQAMRSELVDFLRAHGLSDDEIAEAGEGRELIDLTLSMAILPSRRAYTLTEAAERGRCRSRGRDKALAHDGVPPIPILTITSATDIDVMALQGALEPVHSDGGAREVGRADCGSSPAPSRWWRRSGPTASQRPPRRWPTQGCAPTTLRSASRDSLELERLSFLLDYLHRRQLIAALERRLYWSPDERAVGSGAHSRVRRPHLGYTCADAAARRVPSSTPWSRGSSRSRAT